jgi:dTDP-4-amino-4,6-dideoxygalactose transaminase
MAAYAEGVSLPGTEAAARRHLAIPISPVLAAEQALAVTETIRHALTAAGAPVRL